MLQYVGEKRQEFTTSYGNISAASIGAIQRGLLALETQGGDKFFGEPMLDIADLMQTDADGAGVINILAADKLSQLAQALLHLPAVDAGRAVRAAPRGRRRGQAQAGVLLRRGPPALQRRPKALLEKIEQVVRLIRSKGVGVYFVTQNPWTCPETVLGQLGNRVQHALRAFTPRDQKAVKTAAETMRANPEFDAATVITELGVGEALVSFLDEKGRPTSSSAPPSSPRLPASARSSPAERKAAIENSVIYGHYEAMVDRESAFEVPAGQARRHPPAAGNGSNGGGACPGPRRSGGGGLLGGSASCCSAAPAPRRAPPGLAEQAACGAVRTVGSSIGREIVRGVLAPSRRRPAALSWPPEGPASMNIHPAEVSATSPSPKILGNRGATEGGSSEAASFLGKRGRRSGGLTFRRHTKSLGDVAHAFRRGARPSSGCAWKNSSTPPEATGPGHPPGAPAPLPHPQLDQLPRRRLAQPRLAAGLAGLGWSTARSAAAARPAPPGRAARPRPRRRSPIRLQDRHRLRRWASQAASSGPARRRQLVRRDIAAAVEEGQRAVVGHEVLGKEGLGLPKRSANSPTGAARSPRSGRSETLDGALGFCSAGGTISAPMPIQSRTAAISPKGTPVCTIPKGPGFMPTKTTRLAPPKALQIGRAKGCPPRHSRSL